MKRFGCSWRDVDGKTHTFDLRARDFDDAERRLARLKVNASLDGEIVAEIPANGASGAFFGRILQWWRG